MTEAYPDEVVTFKVIGRLGKGVGDDSDLGQAPNLIPLAGISVFFTPDLDPPEFRVPTADEPLTIFQETVIAVTDENGRLKMPDDDDLGVVLAFGGSPEIIPTGWSWRVRIVPGGNFKDKIFSIMGSANGILDLSDYIPVPANPGAEMGAWVAAVAATEAARDETLGAAEALRLEIEQGDYVGPPGPPNSLAIGTITKLGAGAQPTASIHGDAPNQVLDLGLVTGDRGLQGPNNVLSIGSVTKLGAGSTPAVRVTGQSPTQTLEFDLVTGDTGPANSLTIGTVSKIGAGGNPTASIGGNAPTQSLSLGLVTGDTGAKGDTGVVTVLTNASGVIDCSAMGPNDVKRIAIAGAITGITLPSWGASLGATINLMFIQPAAGGMAVALPTARWNNKIVPVVSQGASAMSIFAFTWYGAIWVGTVVGLDVA